MEDIQIFLGNFYDDGKTVSNLLSVLQIYKLLSDVCRKRDFKN